MSKFKIGQKVKICIDSKRVDSLHHSYDGHVGIIISVASSEPTIEITLEKSVFSRKTVRVYETEIVLFSAKELL